MLRASATRALRQCGRKRNPLDKSPISDSCAVRRGSFQPSTSAASSISAKNPVRCLAGTTDLSVRNAYDSCRRRNDGPLFDLSNSSALRMNNIQRPSLLVSSSLDVLIGPSLTTTFHRQRAFSTNDTRKSSAPSLSSAGGTSLYDDDADEGTKSSGKPTSSVTAPEAKDGTKSAKMDSAAKQSDGDDKSSKSAAGMIEKSIVQKSTEFLSSALRTTISFMVKLPGIVWFYMTHPTDLKAKLAELKEHAVKEAKHFWMGCKLLAADVRTARHILGRTLRGSTLSRRERKQLLRTVTDVFRLVPMSIFLLVPFMEFALPFALKLFPNMLPSTFQDSLKEEEKMKRELQTRISMAGFFQDTLAELAKEQKKVAENRKIHASEASDAESVEIARREASSASAFLEFLKKARAGEAVPPDVIIKFAKNVEDTLMLDNLGRMQLINLCKYMGISPYGSNDLLRFYLRHKIRVLKDDDQRITWEGIDSLTKMELREACRERGMRSTGLSKGGYRAALQQWLDLSVHQSVPISLLIMSRTFYLHDEMVSGERRGEESGIDDGSKSVAGLADVMSGIDKEVLNEIVLEMASSEEKSTNADIRKIQMEVLEHQNELIEEEQQERDAATKEKEEKQKEKATKVEHDQQQQQADAAEARGEDKSATKEEVTDDTTTFGKGDDVPAEDKVFASVTEFDSLESPIAQEAVEKVASTEEEDEQTELSTEEIDAISQLASPDPIQKEREELQRIKDAMGAKEPPTASADEQLSVTAVDESEVQREQTAEASLEMSSAISPSEPIRTEEAQEEAVRSIKELEDAIEKEAKEANVISMDGDMERKKMEEISSSEDVSASEEGVGDAKLQKAIDRLKSRVESMVGKIETQLTDVEVRIGDKFHLLDKDGDGVLTMAEMAQVLQTVLKRKLTPEEAMAIAADMDLNKDGVFTIAELAEWCETNTIPNLAEEGREKDLDEMITERVQERRKLKEEDEDWTGM